MFAWCFFTSTYSADSPPNFHRLWKGYITRLSFRPTLPPIVITRKYLSDTYKANTRVSGIVCTPNRSGSQLPHRTHAAGRWRRKQAHHWKWLRTLEGTNSVALSPQANYTDWTTATCQRNLVTTFVDRGVSRGQCGGSPRSLILVF
jgi:hypothetical protein